MKRKTKTHYSAPPHWQAPCGRWLNFSGYSIEDWAKVTCKRCLAKRRKEKK